MCTTLVFEWPPWGLLSYSLTDSNEKIKNTKWFYTNISEPSFTPSNLKEHLISELFCRNMISAHLISSIQHVQPWHVYMRQKRAWNGSNIWDSHNLESHIQDKIQKKDYHRPLEIHLIWYKTILLSVGLLSLHFKNNLIQNALL